MDYLIGFGVCVLGVVIFYLAVMLAGIAFTRGANFVEDRRFDDEDCC